MSHRLIHTLPETTHGAGRVDILHVSKEKMPLKTKLQVRGTFGKNVADETHAVFGPRAHLCEVAATRLSTTETRRDLVKLFSAGESLSPVPGFGQGSCVPPDP